MVPLSCILIHLGYSHGLGQGSEPQTLPWRAAKGARLHISESPKEGWTQNDIGGACDPRIEAFEPSWRLNPLPRSKLTHKFNMVKPIVYSMAVMDLTQETSSTPSPKSQWGGTL